ncbi:MAG: hypothetical protein CMJ59_06065 [Planctomycetaceae bacterium]|nr:hypothetical protein [Planctomycetaceae bacterium]
MLDREEYVEQAYLFRVIGERLPANIPLQDILADVAEELMSTTKLPMAVSYILSDLKHQGQFAPAMQKLSHYFTPFQTYLVRAAEDDRGRFDMRVAIEILRMDAEYRSQGSTRQGTFLYQFEVLCRNYLEYDLGLTAIAADPVFDEDWRTWILTVRRQVGIVDLADLLYVRSEHYLQRQAATGRSPTPMGTPILFGVKEGRIALAHQRKDPLFLFAALQRHLGYPQVPRPKRVDQTIEVIPQLLRRMERLESRLKVCEEEQRSGAIDLTQYYVDDPARPPPSTDAS